MANDTMPDRSTPRPHLTYCTNVHPGETWTEIFAQLRAHLPAVKAVVAPGRRFGVGLRMSEAAAAELRPDSGAVAEFRAFLAEHGLYVFTINGFPQGVFHGRRVKDAVYLPDWRSAERLAYTDRLARLLAALLEGEPETLEGSISTVPGACKAHLAGPEAAAAIAGRLLRHAALLHDIARRRGRVIALGLEPEPGCLLESIDETVAFFRDHLFTAAAVARFAALTGLARGDAEAALRRHLGLCLDTCHAAVCFEDAGTTLARLAAAGIRIVKLQLSSALVLPRADAAARAALTPFADGVYLHQVRGRTTDGRPLAFADLPEALASPPAEAEWRVHLHVPVWAERCGPFATTRRFLEDILRHHRAAAVTGHLEVETYTWDVLPPAVRTLSLTDSLCKELQWVESALC